MKTNKILKISGLLFCITLATVARGQEDPMYTQYMFNTQTYNPAYAGTWESVGFTMLSRHQWLGIDGAPGTQTLTFQSPLGKKKAAVGFNVIHDRIGEEKKLALFGDYSFKLKLSESTMLRLGVKGGFTSYSNDLTSYDIREQGDQAFAKALENIFLPNFGVGAYMYSDRYYMGLASPKLIQNSFNKKHVKFSSTAEFRHFFFDAGVVFDLNEWLVFKPTALTKFVVNGATQFDLSANFLIHDTVWLGAMYRTSDAIGCLAQILIRDKLRVGYAIDFTLNDLHRFHNGIHEIMVSYELKFIKERLATRYF